MLASGTAICCSHSPSGFVRLNVTVPLALFAMTPPLSVHVAVALRQASAPTIAP